MNLKSDPKKSKGCKKSTTGNPLDLNQKKMEMDCFIEFCCKAWAREQKDMPEPRILERIVLDAFF